VASVGLISDTHGLLRPEALVALRGSDLIIHAGDVGNPEIIEQLRARAPVVDVRANIDKGPRASQLPLTAVAEAGSALIYVLHDLAQLDQAVPGLAVLICRLRSRASIYGRYRGVLRLSTCLDEKSSNMIWLAFTRITAPRSALISRPGETDGPSARNSEQSPNCP
jgi:hypothetical protein